MNLYNGYDYFIWATRDDLPNVEVSDRIALKPHDVKDYRGQLTRKWHEKTDNDIKEYGTVLMDIDKREKTIQFVPYDARYVYRLQMPTENPLHIGRILIVGETTDFRSCARSQVFSNDFVAEIGSSYGDTSVLLSRYVAKTIGFEIGADCVLESTRRYPDLTFINACCFRNADVVIEKSLGCKVCFIDIGGCRCIADQLEVLHWVKVNLHPELIVQKSRKMYASLLAHATKHGISSGSAPLPNMDVWVREEMEGQGFISTNEKKRTSRSGKRKKQAATAAALVASNSVSQDSIPSNL